MKEEEKIIVFDSYDTVMAANLVKTKLDAYGIPCFLSDENFVGLYPIRNELFPGVRLFIFEKDKEKVTEILADVTPSNPERKHCPVCRSVRIEEEFSQKGVMGTVISSLLLGLFLPVKKVYRCADCHHTFAPDA
jgi:hypothetical protein